MDFLSLGASINLYELVGVIVLFLVAIGAFFFIWTWIEDKIRGEEY